MDMLLEHDFLQTLTSAPQTMEAVHTLVKTLSAHSLVYAQSAHS